MRYYNTIVVGGGPSGITCSYYLKKYDIDHLIIEKSEMLHTWKHERWDSFYLVTPNWMTNLPGFDLEIPYNNEYMSKEEILFTLERYLSFVCPNYMENTWIGSISKCDEGYLVSTDRGEFISKHIIIATGMYNNPFLPSVSQKMPENVFQMHSSDYRNPDQLKPGNVVVVGSGWSGVQIALELKKLTGHEVYLSIGSMTPLPTVHRNINGVYWLNRLSGFKNGKAVLSYHLDDFKNSNITNKLNQNLSQCQIEGVVILGRLMNVENNQLIFSDSLQKSIDEAEAYLSKVKIRIEEHIKGEHMKVPNGTLDLDNNRLDLELLSKITELDLERSNIGNIIWSTGFKRDYSWIDLPIFNDQGLPLVEDGVTISENVYFCSLGLKVDNQLKSAFGVGLYAIDESAERTVQALFENNNK
jgi:putative flavoprotein involved in K+ transport